MRKYGKLLLVLGVIAANPVVASADGFLGGRGKPQTPFSGSAEKVRNQAKADEVASALKSGNVQGTDIEIEVKDGVAIISGKVHEASQRALVQQLASSVPGITRVENNLRFVPPAGGGVERAAASRSADSRNPIQRVSGEAPAAGQDNTAVANQIAASLSQVGLVGYDVEIRFNNGTATLSGEVATVGQRQAAGAAASQTPGVRSVNNQLKVTGPISQTGFQPQGIPGGSPEMMQMQGQGMPPQLMGPGMPQQMMGPGMPPQMMGPGMPPQMMGQGMPPQMMQQAGYMQPGMNPGMNPTPSGYAPTSFNNPNLPSHAWPSYAQYPNSAAVSYPTQYSASAFPYIGPFYPYPQVPMGWREVSLEWDDGQWNLNFNKEKDKWYWVLHPKNW
jgi:osmotically-inducible protein OsmY